jgi:hypothetical protein
LAVEIEAPGRPAVTVEIRQLIRQMSGANPLWRAPRIHGELLNLVEIVVHAQPIEPERNFSIAGALLFALPTWLLG